MNTTTQGAQEAPTAPRVSPEDPDALPADCYLSITKGASVGRPMFGNVDNKFLESSCPQNAAYIAGQPVGSSVTLWAA
jgi:hypothetical protein